MQVRAISGNEVERFPVLRAATGLLNGGASDTRCMDATGLGLMTIREPVKRAKAHIGSESTLGACWFEQPAPQQIQPPTPMQSRILFAGRRPFF